MKALILLLIFSTLVLAEKDMETLYLKNACHSCHGMYGEGIGASPRLQGVKEHILLRRLKDLQAGKPRSAFGSIMISFAQALDENETKAMAKYLTNLKTIIPDDRYDIEYSTVGDGGS
ncbi:MAG: c-type cytochrome [Sulfurovum sp.]|nr:c-type cytochrome [Sulfurovum sp.]